MPVKSATDRAVRIRHYQGERLVAEDLQDGFDVQQWLRALHVVGLHDTWGIALGLEVQAAPDLLGVLVNPGLAYDALGYEVVLSRPEIRPFPPGRAAGDPLDLVLSRPVGPGPADADLSPCVGEGAADLSRPAFAWRRPADVRLGREVPLVRATLTANGKLALDASVRRYVDALNRPHIASGLTPREHPWTAWKEERGESSVGVQIRVDTSDAGFVGTPFYFAQLRLDPQFALQVAKAQVFLFTSIAEEGPAGFTFRIAVGEDVPPAPPPIGITRALPAAATRGGPLFPGQVSWLGVEPVRGCRPAIAFAALIARIDRLILLSRGPLGGLARDLKFGRE